jgi:hypothetical protein
MAYYTLPIEKGQARKPSYCIDAALRGTLIGCAHQHLYSVYYHTIICQGNARVTGSPGPVDFSDNLGTSAKA